MPVRIATSALVSSNNFHQGPTPIFRDCQTNFKLGYTVRDKNYLSARWPGDAHKFATQFLAMVQSAKT